MKLVYFLTLLAALVSLAVASPAQNKTEHFIKLSEKDLSVKATTSDAVPEKVPIPIHRLQQAAAIASQQYCTNQTVGTQVADAKILWSAGMGFVSQRMSILDSKSLGLVLAFEGTTPTGPLSWYEDFESEWDDPDSRYSSSFSSGAKIQYGFQLAYVIDADKALEQVKSFMKKKKTDKVTVVGHSLGAAMALLAAAHLETDMKGSVHQILTFGQPRVGNVQFADDIDKLFKGKLYYTINGDDLVARLGPRNSGYQHPSGQIWINPANSDNWKFYPGQENIHGSISSTPSPFILSNHCGTYYHTHIDHFLGFRECPAKAGQD